MIAQEGPPPGTPPEDPNLDLGFGSVVSRESRQRLLNRDGTFNVKREGLGFWKSLSIYHYLLTISWGRFLAYVAVSYLGLNALFAAGYLLCGESALSGGVTHSLADRLDRAFFFSVDSMATIGYGNVAPETLAANLLVTAESLLGLLGFALVAGIMFARFARPVVDVWFSRNAIIAPYRDRTAFMFRIVNQRSNEIVDLEARVLLSRRKKDGAHVAEREFLPMRLERERVVFFPLSWTIVHPIDESSPLWGMGPDAMLETESEFLILLNGFDETFSQTVHTRSSYKPQEVVWGAKFSSMFNPAREDGVVSIDIRKLDEFVAAPLASPLPAKGAGRA
jgi:Inward rectifier potassium channel.